MLRSLSTRIEPFAQLLLRALAGAMFSFHGMQKVLGVATASQPELGSQIWVGGVLELVLGPLIAVGLLTRPAAFLASGMMAVAYLQFHWKLSFADFQWAPAVNKGELAALYSVYFFWLACAGPGARSLDQKLGLPIA